MLFICNIRFYISSKDAFLFSLDNPVFQFYIILFYHNYIVDKEITSHIAYPFTKALIIYL